MTVITRTRFRPAVEAALATQPPDLSAAGATASSARPLAQIRAGVFAPQPDTYSLARGDRDVDLGCRPVTVAADPAGAVESITSPGSGTLRIVDPGSAPSDCHVLTVDDLRPSAREQVRAGLPSGTKDDATEQMRRLVASDLLPLCTPEPTPTPTPTAPARSPPSP